MNNTIKLFGLMALVAIIGFSMIACDDDSGDDGSIIIDGWKFNVVNDKNDGGTSSIAMSRDGNHSNELTVTGNLTKNIGDDSYKYGFSTLSMTPPADVLSQIKSAGSVTFYITGDDNTYYLQVATSDIKDYCYYRTTFTTDADNQRKSITVNFSSLSQPDWGTQVNFNANNITSVEIHINTEVSSEGAYSFTLAVNE